MMNNRNIKLDKKFPYNIGSIIINDHTNQEYGVYIKQISNQYYFFRLHDGYLPKFSTIDKIPDSLIKIGNINEEEYTKLKNELLKYYTMNNIGANERILLKEVMNFAFPNGIPEFNTETPLSEEEVLKMNLNYYLEPGNSFLLHTPTESSLNDLNDKLVYMIEKKKDGIWVVLPSTNIGNSIFKFLFYNNRKQPSFGGISRIQYSPENNLDDYDDYLNLFKKQEPIITEINNNGNIAKLDINNKKAIFPSKDKYKVYCPKKDELIKTQEYLDNNSNNTTQTIFSDNIDEENDEENDRENNNINNEDNYEENKIMAQFGGVNDDVENNIIDIFEKENQEREHELNKFIENNKKDETNSIEKSDELDELDIYEDFDIELLDALKSKKSKKSDKSKKLDKSDKSDKSKKSDKLDELNKSSEFNNEYESDGDIEEEIDFEDIEFIEVIEKNIIQEKEEKDKFYNENLQINELNKLFMSKIPFILQTNSLIIAGIKKKVNNFMAIKNNIILNKNYKSEDIGDKLENKPLLLKYGFGNLNNKFLTPLVIYKKKIYLEENSKYDKDNYKDEFVNLQNFYEELKSINYLREYSKYNKNKDITQLYDYFKFNKEIQEILNPVDSEINLDNTDKYNILKVKLGNLNKEVNNINLTDINNICVNKNEFNKIKIQNKLKNKDVFCISYCKKPFNCQNINSLNEEVQFNTSLSNPFRFVPLNNNNNNDNDNDNDNTNKTNEIKFINRLNVYNEIDNSIEGENINIIGFVRLPLNNIYNIKNNSCSFIKNINIEEIYTELLENGKFKVIEINNNSNLDDDIFFKHENHIVIYLFVKNKTSENSENSESSKNTKEDEFLSLVNKIIPNYKTIIEYHENDIKKSTNINLLYEILELFDYNYEYLDNNINNYIEKIKNYVIDKKITNINKFFDKIKNYSIDSIKNEKKVIFIEDYIINDFEKITGINYVNKNKSNDSNISRYDWIINIKNGLEYLNMLLLQDLYEKQNTDNIISVIEQDIINTKKEIDILNVINDNKKESKICNNKSLHNVKIVKYSSMKELENSNGKDIVDENNNLIVEGDIAIVIENKEKRIFKRGNINGVFMWIAETKNYLKNILEEEKLNLKKMEVNEIYDKDKQLCHSIYSDYFNFDLNEPNCSFNIDNMTCDSFTVTNNQRKIKEKKDYLESLEIDIDYFKNIGNEINKIKKKVKKYKNKLMINKRIEINQEKYKLDKIKELKELQNKLIAVSNNCVHNKMLNYINKIKNNTQDELYKFYQILLNRFENTNFLIDTTEIYSEEETKDITKKNYITCNVCNQNLICKHWYLGVSNLETNGDINLEQIINIYGIETNGIYSCKICGEYLGSTDTLDLIEMGKGDQGKVLMKREVIKDESNKVNLIDTYLKELEIEEKYDSDLYFRMEFYYHIKQILNLRMRTDDEKEMILFIKTHNFIKKEAIYSKIRMEKKSLPKKVIHTIVLSRFNRMVCADIASRFLIILQTSKKEYLIKTTFCSNNYMGYPLINDINEKNGINLVYCIFKQFALRQKYKFLEKGMEKLFIDRIYYFVNNDEFVKNKLIQAIDDKANNIFKILDFSLYGNNLWRDFLPHMMFNIDWKPDKRLLKKELKLLSGKNFEKMKNTALQNIFYISSQLSYLINQIIYDEIVRNKFFKTALITNSCCIENINSYLPYYQYFMGKNKDIRKIYNDLMEMNDNFKYIKYNNCNKTLITKLQSKLYNKKSRKRIPLHFNITQKEINDFFIKYIDEGIYIGKQHIYNDYGICILSNIFKSTIENTTYSIHEFNKLRYTIYKNNMILSKTNVDQTKLPENLTKENSINFNLIKQNKNIDLNNKTHAITFLNYIIDYIKENPKLTIFKNILGQIITNIKNDNTEKNNANWATLITQTKIDISNLTKNIFNNKNDINFYTEELNNLCDYKNLYEEVAEKTDYKDADYFRFKKKENELKKNYQFLNTSILLIKNEKFKYEKKIDNIRNQFQYLFPFKDNNITFTGLYKIISNYKEIFKYIEGQKKSYLTSENISIILHYLFIHCLLMMLYKSKNKNQSKNQSKSKNTNNEFYTIIKFLNIFIKQITKKQQFYDNLTNKYIYEKQLKFGEKQQRRNLKVLYILKTEEGMEEYRNMILSKLHYGFVEYSDLEQELKTLNIDNDLNYDNNTVDVDDIDDKELYNENYSEFDDPNFTDGNFVYGSDDDVEDADYII